MKSIFRAAQSMGERVHKTCYEEYVGNVIPSNGLTQSQPTHILFHVLWFNSSNYTRFLAFTRYLDSLDICRQPEMLFFSSHRIQGAPPCIFNLDSRPSHTPSMLRLSTPWFVDYEASKAKRGCLRWPSCIPHPQTRHTGLESQNDHDIVAASIYALIWYCLSFGNTKVI